MRIAIAGLGTVGCGLINMIEAQNKSGGGLTSAPTSSTASTLNANQGTISGNLLQIVAVNARSRDKKRDADVRAYEWVDNPMDLAQRDDVDCVIELIGGSEGIAKDLVMAALKNGKHVITANKALIAYHGVEISKHAQENGVFFGYEAAVAGGIPVIKALRESFAGNQVSSISGILNGTCNYILSTMRETGQDFADVLKDAQDLGYAEADPAFDVDGVDAAHKMAILAGLAYGVSVPFDDMPVTGIRSVQSSDISYAGQMGYRIKLLGLGERNEKGDIRLSVEPCFVPKDNPIAHIEGVLNAVLIEADPVGSSMLVGRGAGAGPTASSVYADILDCVRGQRLPLYGVGAEKLQPLEANFATKQADQTGRYYIRLNVQDEPGVIADLTLILKDYNISISDMIQHGRDAGNPVDLVLIVHETAEGTLRSAAQTMHNLESVLNAPVIMRIL